VVNNMVFEQQTFLYNRIVAAVSEALAADDSCRLCLRMLRWHALLAVLWLRIKAVARPQRSSLEDARKLLDALEAELCAADEEAAAAGVQPDAPVPLAELPAALRQAQQAPPSPPPPRQQQRDQQQQQQQQQQAAAAPAAAPPKQWERQKPQPEKAEPIVGEHKSEWAPPAAPAPEELPAPPGDVRAEGSGHEILLQVRHLFSVILSISCRGLWPRDPPAGPSSLCQA